MRVIDIPGHVPEVSDKISSEAVRQALEESGIEYLVTLPESPYEQLLRDLLQGSRMKVVQVARESQGMAVCCGITYGGKRSALLCSYKGLYNSIDSLLGVALRTQSSFLVLVSEAGVSPERAALDPERGRHSVALLQALKIPYYEVWTTDDLNLIRKAMAETEGNTQPVALVLRW
ncbi:MAG: hypothetical protein HYY01_08295 [Chloroflexi bacterium]|nr:hypothetical protein [Chloroflexota bacterium]